MKIIRYGSSEPTVEEIESWKAGRRTKITGTRLKDIVVLRGTGEKKGFYELVAERLALPRPENENVMERGHRLETEAISICEQELGKTFNKDLVIWEREDEQAISISPDAYLEDFTEAVEVKCINSADHIKAVLENAYPDEYYFQALQYFIVNEKLEKLHFIMYDPSLTVKQYIRFEINREDVQDDVEKYLEYQRLKLEKINEIVNQLSF